MTQSPVPNKPVTKVYSAQRPILEAVYTVGLRLLMISDIIDHSASSIPNLQFAQQQAVHVEGEVNTERNSRSILYDVQRRPERRAVEAMSRNRVQKLLDRKVGHNVSTDSDQFLSPQDSCAWFKHTSDH